MFSTTTGQPISSVTVPATNVPIDVSISGDVSSLTSNISIRVFPRTVNAPIYIDDVSLS